MVSHFFHGNSVVNFQAAALAVQSRLKQTRSFRSYRYRNLRNPWLEARLEEVEGHLR
jgi:hypothetical protein